MVQHRKIRWPAVVGTLKMYACVWIGISAVLALFLSVDQVAEYLVGSAIPMMVMSGIGFLVGQTFNGKPELSDNESISSLLSQYRRELLIGSALFFAAQLALVILVFSRG